MEDQLRHYSNKLKYEIDSWDLSEILKTDDKVIVLDVRSKEAYEQEHIPDAINIPHREMTDASTNQLEKDVLYISYCDGIGCNGSTKGALKMSELGFKVKELIGGLDWWKRDGYPTRGIVGLSEKKVVCGC